MSRLCAFTCTFSIPMAVYNYLLLFPLDCCLLFFFVGFDTVLPDLNFLSINRYSTQYTHLTETESKKMDCSEWSILRFDSQSLGDFGRVGFAATRYTHCTWSSQKETSRRRPAFQCGRQHKDECRSTWILFSSIRCHG
jgi:hypothetical protein